jgi:hypothetical protein
VGFIIAQSRLQMRHYQVPDRPQLVQKHHDEGNYLEDAKGRNDIKYVELVRKSQGAWTLVRGKEEACQSGY